LDEMATMPGKLPVEAKDDAPEIFCRTADEFEKVFVRELYKRVADGERKAFATQKTVEIGFGMAYENGTMIMEVRYRCEPGKPARRIE
jgi:hypothetical protein